MFVFSNFVVFVNILSLAVSSSATFRVTFQSASALLPSLSEELTQILSTRGSVSGAGFINTERLQQMVQEDRTLLSEVGGVLSERNASGPTQFIFGGTETDIIQYPWQVAIEIDLNNVKGSNSNPQDWFFNCGCALISKRWCLTAAHCVKGLYEIFNFRVRLGVDNVNNPEDEGQIIPVFTAVYHPKWTDTCNRTGPCFAYDIAAIRFSRDAIFNRAVRPVRINSERKCLRKYECVQTGFGLREGGQFDGKLRKGVIPPFPSKVCNYNWLVASQNAIFDGHLCIFDTNEKVSNCFGDSGGPYVCRRGPKTPWILVGLVSFGFVLPQIPVCTPILPNVNTRVSFHCRWIRSVTGLPKYCTY